MDVSSSSSSGALTPAAVRRAYHGPFRIFPFLSRVANHDVPQRPMGFLPSPEDSDDSSETRDNKLAYRFPCPHIVVTTLSRWCWRVYRSRRWAYFRICLIVRQLPHFMSVRICRFLGPPRVMALRVFRVSVPPTPLLRPAPILRGLRIDPFAWSESDFDSD